MFTLAWHTSFKKAYTKFIKKHPYLRDKIIQVFKLLEKDPYQKKLMTHKLHGDLRGYYACSIEYSYRLVFSIEKINTEKFIVLIDIGKHDEAY